jgi:hypothetical protein
MVPRGLGGQRQLLRAGLRQGAASRSQKRLVPVERQLLHPLRALNREHPSITRSLRDDCETMRHSSGSNEQMFGAE